MKEEFKIEEEIRELKENLKHGQDGSPLQELANNCMRKRLKELDMKEEFKTLKDLKINEGCGHCRDKSKPYSSEQVKQEAIKRAKHYKSEWLDTGDYYYKGMLDAEVFANNITEEDLKEEQEKNENEN